VVFGDLAIGEASFCRGEQHHRKAFSCPPARFRGRIRDLVWNAGWVSDLACSRQWTADETVTNYRLGLPKTLHQCLMCMKGESYGEVDLHDEHVTRRLHRRRAWRLWLNHSPGRRSGHLDLRACVVIPHLSLRTESVRDDAVLGNRAHGSGSATVRTRLCEAVAGSGENR